MSTTTNRTWTSSIANTKEGKISKHDYLERKKEIEQGSVVY
ncbi:MAG: hypothetical protein P8180_15870 [Gammaproteobacteria bacterium]|jgi:hypothetical protein